MGEWRDGRIPLSVITTRAPAVCGAKKTFKQKTIRDRVAPPLKSKCLGWDGTYPLGTDSPKKIAVLLDAVQMRGGRALPKFFVHFSQTVYIGSIWGWGGGERPLPKFFGTLALKKVVQVVQIRGGRGGGAGELK